MEQFKRTSKFERQLITWSLVVAIILYLGRSMIDIPDEPFYGDGLLLLMLSPFMLMWLICFIGVAIAVIRYPLFKAGKWFPVNIFFLAMLIASQMPEF